MRAGARSGRSPRFRTPGTLALAAALALAGLWALPYDSAGKLPRQSSGRVLFVSDRAGGDDIYSIRPDGRGTRLKLDEETDLADPISGDSPFGFGPGPLADGGLIFTRHLAGGNSQVRGLFEDVLVRYSRKPSLNRQPASLFGGLEIVYVSDRDGDDELRRASAFDQLEPRLVRVALGASRRLSPSPRHTIRLGAKLTKNDASDREPTVAPLRARIAFTSDRDGDDDIWARPRGDRATQLTDDPAPDYQPAFSPDGRQIAFVSERDGNPEIYLMDGRGEQIQRLTTDPGADTEPSFSPDGTLIAFVSDRDGGPDVYRMRVDGSGLRNVTRSPGTADASPFWGIERTPFDCFIDVPFSRLRGTPAADNLIGSGDRELIRGFGGRDTARGRGSKDCIFGEKAGDLLFGNSGEDKLIGAGGFDRLHGGRGRDLLDGGASADKLRGGAKTDALVGGRGDDRLDGSPGADLLIGGAGEDQLLGGEGDDVIIADLGRDRVSCGRGRDIVLTIRRRRDEARSESCRFVAAAPNSGIARQIGLSLLQFFEATGQLPFGR